MRPNEEGICNSKESCTYTCAVLVSTAAIGSQYLEAVICFNKPVMVGWPIQLRPIVNVWRVQEVYYGLHGLDLG
jgi:hypothetical protein